MGKKKEKKRAKKLAEKSEKKKSTKKKKKAASNSDLRICPGCKKHCPLAAPKCSKGRKLVKKLGL